MASGYLKNVNRNTAATEIINYVIKHLILLKIQSMTDINVDLLQWAIEFKHRFCIKELLIWISKDN